MNDLNRRTLLRTGGTLGALGAVAVAAPVTPWTWSPAGSVPGRGSGADPRTVWDPEADPVVARLLDRGQVPKVNQLLRGWTKNGQALPAGLPSELRDFIVSAWTASGSASIGWPAVKVAEVEAGTADPWIAMVGED